MKWDRSLYPFTSNYFLMGGLRLHYLDEGAGDPIVMLHGNPTWSFYFRNLVLALRDKHRCIVPDHIGCGLSDKPDDQRYDFSLRRRVDDLEQLLRHLRVDSRATLVLHDWGGMIGMAWAVRHPESVARLVILNTAAFPLPAVKRLPWGLWLARNTRLGAWLTLRGNAFCRAAARWCVTRRPLPDKVRQGLLAPYDTPNHRRAVLRFVQNVPLGPSDPGYDIVKEVEANLHRFRNIPTLICWGMRDFVFDETFLATWQKHLPAARVVRFPDCGHYILEDAPDEVIREVQAFLASSPVGGSGA
ncbi:MAG: alpha/beta fold hydrolase [Gemmataceae bacterium]|nr:alpha/beta fold hydrolase [Gemmataceae bacterium]